MKTILHLIIITGIFAVITSNVFSQVGISVNGSPPNPSAGLDVNFSNKGLLPPRMTIAQRNTITNPAEGLMVYCTNCNSDGTGLLTIFQGGQWNNFNSECPEPSVPEQAPCVSGMNQITWNWHSVLLATGYRWNTIDNYPTSIDVGSDSSYTETGLNSCTAYYRYVWAYNGCTQAGLNTYSNLLLMQTTLPMSFSPAPTQGIHVASSCQIIWNWNPVTGASGYKWNSVNDYTTAIDMGTATTKTQAGVAANTLISSYVWAYSDPCHASSATTLTCQSLPGLSVGQTYGGGVIFYLDGTCQHGLIAAATDQSAGAPWGCIGTSIPGTSVAIGTGQANTTAIINGCSTAGIAARICNDLVMNGHDDWFLPSKDELNLMYSLKTVIGEFGNNHYWSSSEWYSGGAWDLDFSDGSMGNASSKANSLSVRAVRAF